MKKQIMVVSIILILLFIIFIGFHSNKNRILGMKEKIDNAKTISEHDYSLMGLNYNDKIYERFDTVSFGKYHMNNSITSEPIEWIVLEKDNDRALLLSKYIIDISEFSKDKFNNIWSKSDIRIWLNNSFFNAAFSFDEKEMIIITKNENKCYSDWNNKLIDDDMTEDKVFLLSENEYNKYFSNNGIYDNEVIKKLKLNHLGEYVESKYNGITSCSSYSQGKSINYDDETNNASYLLRTHSYGFEDDGNGVLQVDIYGNINTTYVSAPNGVRPAIWVSY